MIPVKKEKFDGIIDELNELYQSNQINEFILAKYTHEAEKLKSIDLAMGFTVLAIISFLKNDIDNVHHNHKMALRYSQKPVFYFNYCVSLRRLDEHDECYRYAKESYNIGPEDERVLQILTKCCNQLGLEDEFQKYAGEFKELTGKDCDLLQFPEDDPETLKSILDIADELIENHPELIVEPDPEIVDLAFKLVEGIDLGE